MKVPSASNKATMVSSAPFSQPPVVSTLTTCAATVVKRKQSISWPGSMLVTVAKSSVTSSGLLRSPASSGGSAAALIDSVTPNRVSPPLSSSTHSVNVPGSSRMPLKAEQNPTPAPSSSSSSSTPPASNRRMLLSPSPSHPPPVSAVNADRSTSVNR